MDALSSAVRDIEPMTISGKRHAKHRPAKYLTSFEREGVGDFDAAPIAGRDVDAIGGIVGQLGDWIGGRLASIDPIATLVESLHTTPVDLVIRRVRRHRL